MFTFRHSCIPAFLHSCIIFILSVNVVPESFKSPVILTPVFGNFYPQFEKDMLVEEYFDIAAGIGSELFDGRALVPEQYPLLGFACNEDRCRDPRQVVLLNKRFDGHLRGIGNLLGKIQKDLFPDDLRDKETLAAVGQFIFRVECR